MNITKPQEILLGVLSQVLSGTEYKIPADTDWAELFAESRAQAVIPIMFSGISQYCTDEAIRQTWRTYTMRSLQKSRRIQLCHNYLHQLMTNNGIPYTIIKGCASANDYPDPLMRAMGDVDFLVPKEHWEHAVEVMQNEGFISRKEGHAFHLGFEKPGFPSEIEMHHDPFGIAKLNMPALTEIIPEVVSKSVEVNIGDITFRMPDPFCHGTVLLLHALRHLRSSGIGVRHLCDWAMFIRNFNEDEFVCIFKERYEKLKIWKLAQVFSATAHRYLGVPYQSWMDGADAEDSLMLMLDILNGGNFGRGSGLRDAQNRFIFNKGKGWEASTKNGKVQLIRNLNAAALERYPRLMKIKILRPFGCVLIAVCYLFRVLTGKRRMLPKDTMQMADMRRKLYQKIGVIEVESIEKQGNDV